LLYTIVNIVHVGRIEVYGELNYAELKYTELKYAELHGPNEPPPAVLKC